ncbi:MAG: glycosyl hydrolase [Pirellulaceae bacterium]
MAAIMFLAVIASVTLCAEESTRGLAVDYPLTTDTKVDYDALKAGYSDVPEASKLRSFWFWQYGLATKESITQDLEAMKAKGYGGALLGDNGGPEGQVGPVFMSEEWKANFAHAVKEAARLGLELSLNIQSGWGDPGNPNIQPDNGMKKIVFSEVHVIGPKKLQQRLPKPKFRIYYRDIAVQAFKRVDAEGDTRRSTLVNWANKSFNAQSGLDEIREMLPNSADDVVIGQDSIVDLTGRFSGETLTWDVPEGEWTIIRYGMAATGKRNGYAAPGYRGGLCYDQIHANGVKAQWNDVAQPLIDIAKKNGNSLKYVHTDSWEMKLTNWTHDFRETFKRLRGYDMSPFLPVLANKLVGNRELSNRFLEDFRLTVSDLVAEENYQVLRDLAHANGLLLHSESGGPHRAPLEALQTLGKNDVPMSEFWARTNGRRVSEAARIHVKQGSSAAHVYGKRYLAAEGPTSIGPQWERAPRELKGNLDKIFCLGVNRLFWHTYTSAPDEYGIPGFEYFAGTHMNRHVTWWDQCDTFVAYLNRCQYMLAQGLYGADVLAYYGSASPNFVYLESDIDVPRGHAWDMCNTEVLLSRATTRNGRIYLPDGMNYALLYLKPGINFISLPVLRKIERMVKDGIVLVGNPPERAAGLTGYPASDKEVRAIAKRLWGKIDGKNVFANTYGEGRVYAGKTIAEVLELEAIKPDFSYTANKDVDLSYIHRSADDLDIYYIVNKWAYKGVSDLEYRRRSGLPSRYIRAICSFRADGDRLIERFDPVTGRITPVLVYERKGGRYEVPISLPPEGSAFFVFRKGPERRHITRITKDGKAVAQGNAPLQLNASGIFVRGGGVEVIRQDAYELTWSDGKTEKLASTALPPDQTIEGSWKTTFMERPSLGEPITDETDVLKSWTESSQREIKYFSGTARYTKIVDFADEVKSRRVYLDLGNVLDLVTVRLNGKVVDTCWIAPFRVDITDHLVKGRNLLELDVTNCWANRLIGDGKLPKEQRRTQSNVGGKFQKPGSEKLLRVSGLLGPVRLQFAEIVSLSVSK